MEDHGERGGHRNRQCVQTVGLHTTNCKSFNLRHESLGFHHFDRWISRDLVRLVDNCESRIQDVAKWDRQTRNCDVSKSFMQNPPIDH